MNFVGKIFYFLKVINRKKDLDLRFKDDKIKLQKKFYQKQSFFEVLRSFFIDLIFNIKKDSNLSMLKVKQISKIYPTMQDLYAFMNNKANSNYNIFYQKKKGLEISHNQEQISTFSAEHNQDCYALNYK
ncbi:MAG: hypothetical protein ACXW1A_03560 [Nitrososphaeraceae archaeon]